MSQTEIKKITQLARQKLAAGDAHAAILLARQVMKTGHSSVPLLEVYSQAAMSLGDLDSAVASIEKAIRSGDATLERVLFYGDLLLKKQSWQSAADVFQQVIKQVDSNSLAWLGLGLALQGAGDIARAAQCYQGAVERDPKNSDAVFRLGLSLLYMGDGLRASVLLDDASRAQPDSAERAYYYGESLRQSTAVDKAIDVLSPWRTDTNWGYRVERALIMCFLSTERFAEAEALLEAKLQQCPDDIELLSCKARLLVVDGDKAKARELIETVLEKGNLSQVSWEAYTELLDAPMQESMLNKLYQYREAAAAANQWKLVAGTHFAAYQHFSLAGQTDKEIKELVAGNAIMAELAPFNWQRHEKAVKQVREAYSAGVIGRLSSRSELEVVHILCPPRSGSTLLEQALSRHSRFWAAGEKNFAGQAWNGLAGDYALSTNIEMHEALTPGQVEQFARDYLRAAQDAGWEEGQWMIQKGINAHKFAGLLKAAFPKSRFIDLRRNPMDVAFGCFRQNFESQPFSFTPEGIAAEIQLFQSNMGWWHEQMSESIYKVSYERLVRDFEGEIRELLGWLGLEWEGACLEFGHKSRVSTASVNQVRQGLFTKGLGRWKKYGDLLLPLRTALEERGVQVE